MNTEQCKTTRYVERCATSKEHVVIFRRFLPRESAEFSYHGCFRCERIVKEKFYGDGGVFGFVQWHNRFVKVWKHDDGWANIKPKGFRDE